MRIHYLQHVPFEGLGSIQAWAEKQGHGLTATFLFEGQTFPRPHDFDWLIVMGGPMSIHDEDRYPWLVEEKRFIREAIAQNKVVLGICLGAQLIADVLGAEIFPSRFKEIGWFSIRKSSALPAAGISEALPEQMDVFHWHGETFSLPDGAIRIAGSEACENQGFIYKDRVVGFQFHLETTPDSAQNIIENCSDEIVDAPYIQSAVEMLADPMRFDNINHVMSRVLACFENRS